MGIIPDLSNSLNTANSYNRADGTTGPRIPMLFTCSAWNEAGIAPIALRVNAHNVTFKQGKRVTKRNTSGGTAYIHWADENGENNDVLEISFKGRTGNINLKKDPKARKTIVGQAAQDMANWLSGTSADNNGAQNQGGDKLFIWSRLYQLTRAPMINVTTRKKNIFYIVYRSPLFPRPIRFSGFFNGVLDFTETAESPHLVEWSFNFVVQSTTPNLNMLSDYLVHALADYKGPTIRDNVLSGALIADDKVNINFSNG